MKKLTNLVVGILAFIFIPMFSGIAQGIDDVKFNLDEGTECISDFDGDGDVDCADMSIFEMSYGRDNCSEEPPCHGDCDEDDDVDGTDLHEFKKNFPIPPYYFYDDFECGAGKWVISGLDWGLIDSEFQKDNWSLSDSPDGNYLPNADAIAKMRFSIDLSNATAPVLTFWHKYLLNSRDYVYVDVSTDGGFTWTNLWYTGNGAWVDTWTPEIIDLSSYINATVKIRFRLLAADGNVHDGWYIDDVTIREYDDIAQLPFPFSDNFEGGLGNWEVSGTEWNLVESGVRGGEFAISDSPDGNYSPNAHSVIISDGFFDLSISTSPALTFWHKYLLNSRDYAYVQISTDGGYNWTNLWFAGNGAWVDTWTLEIIDLSAYKSSSVMIRFLLRASDGNVHDGWHIDDVNILEWPAHSKLAYPFADDFENGLDNWEISGLEWNLVESGSRGGEYAITDSPDGNYSPNSQSVIITKGYFDLSGSTSPVLTFWDKYLLNSRDYAYVQISTDTGFTWTNLWYVGNGAWVDTWTPEIIDLSAYKSPSVMIRFLLRGSDGNVHDGWHIDDVVIRELDDLPDLSYPFCDDFESGFSNWWLSGLDWGLTANEYRSPALSITDSPEGNYSPNAYSVLMTYGTIDLSDATFPVLTYWNKYRVTSRDYIDALISTDYGLTWNLLQRIGNGAVIDTWKEELLDLRPYIGDRAIIRFQLRASDGNVSDGWYVDDFCVKEFE